MADLRVKIAGLEYENPVIVAAGPPSKDAQACRACVENGAAGVVAKTVSSVAANVPKPCMHDFKGKSFINTELWSELSVEHWVENEYAKCKVANEPLIIGMGYVEADIRKLIPMLDKYADAYEISSHYVGRDLTPMLNTLRAAKELTKKPVFMKVSPGVENLGEVAKALQENGADGLVAINSVGPCLSIDIETGKPLMGSATGYGWMSGPAIKPIAMRVVYELAKAVDIPVFAVGGIATGEDVIEMMMAGASAVQVCTQGIIEGPKAFGRIAKETSDWLDKHGYKSINDIKGITIKYLKEREAANYITNPPVVDKDKCVGCGICKTVCGYKAITIVDKKAIIDGAKCFGCGVCVSKCPTKAMSIAR
ncbi:MULTISPECIES: 4Fe-4S binding protein [Fusobacterium]|jgi:dihydropyrimidine dehydrogenase (NAD+) subunit PreA|uniref:dihydrouracil dehydrogenase (NAD(+)) n=1 Tax=Fusobacterium hominis TaxID=2764326 RepID=A0A7G9GWG8_9FUSO|nr:MULTISPECIES: 4Fe-4S binding protein [Fusobacterium]QNM15150.1 4Fe-4S binding protein [Fusobacterium hominis]